MTDGRIAKCVKQKYSSGLNKAHAMVVKKPITVRVEAELLAEARRCAIQENRILTNFIETVLRRRIRAIALERPTGQHRLHPHNGGGPADAA